MHKPNQRTEAGGNVVKTLKENSLDPSRSAPLEKWGTVQRDQNFALQRLCTSESK